MAPQRGIRVHSNITNACIFETQEHSARTATFDDLISVSSYNLGFLKLTILFIYVLI